MSTVYADFLEPKYLGRHLELHRVHNNWLLYGWHGFHHAVNQPLTNREDTREQRRLKMRPFFLRPFSAISTWYDIASCHLSKPTSVTTISTV